MRNYLLHFLYATLFILIASIIFALWAEPIYGDLTRIGKWTEHDYGPNLTQPAVHIQETGRSLTNPDVMVLGDSFSESNLWQSVLASKSGHVIKSFHYDQNCIQNWIESAITMPANKIIIIETVEREFIKRFSRLPLCKSSIPIALEVKAESKENIRPMWPPTLNFFKLVLTAINTIEINIYPEKIFNRFFVVNMPLRAECAKFSNRRNDRILYYAEDEYKNQWTPAELNEAIANVLKIQKLVEQSGRNFAFVIAPDKASVYQNCLLDNNALKETPNTTKILINSSILAPDLIRLFKENVNCIVDLYDPDNTHWSSAGYILAGNEISRYLSKQ